MAKLTIQHRTIGPVTVIDVIGRLTMGEDSVMLRDSVRGLLGADQKCLLINMQEVGYIDSSGLGELVSAFATAKKQGASLKLVNVTKRARGLLQMTKLLTIFETFDSEADAVSSFEANTLATTSP